MVTGNKKETEVNLLGGITEIKKEAKSEANTVRQIAVVLGVLSIVLPVLVILMTVNAIPTMNNNRAARLVNVGMGGNNLPDQHVLHITG